MHVAVHMFNFILTKQFFFIRELRFYKMITYFLSCYLKPDNVNTWVTLMLIVTCTAVVS